MEKVAELEYRAILRWIATERRKMGVTQQELGDRLGLTRAHISNIECSRHATSIETVLRMMRALGLNMYLENPNPVQVRPRWYTDSRRRYDLRDDGEL